MKNWFEGCTTLEDAKRRYYELCKKYHPDVNPGQDTTATMQEINNEYDRAFDRLKNTHRNAQGETYTSKTETSETVEEFRDIINQIIRFEGCRIEVIGSWLWVSGNTRVYKDILKNIGFKWSHNKEAWYYHEEGYRKHSKKVFNMDEIRGMFGTQDVETIENRKIAAAH